MTARIGAQLGRRHAAVAGHVVPRLPRDALVDRAASLEGLAVHEVPCDRSPAGRGRSAGKARGRLRRAWTAGGGDSVAVVDRSPAEVVREPHGGEEPCCTARRRP